MCAIRQSLMKRLAVFTLFCALILLVSCAPIKQGCEKPFILKDGECCLDLDDDGSCDTEQNVTEGKIEEPEIVVEETKTVEVEPNKKETKKEAETEEEPLEITEELTEEEIAEFEESASIDASDLPGQLMKTYTEDVEGYKYNYRGDWYFVRGDNIKVKLGESEQYTRQDVGDEHYAVFFVDTVYMSVINKTAVGYCEGNDPRLGNRRCAELELIDVPYPLIYGNFYTKRPDEWLFEVYTLDPEIKTETGYYYLGPRKVKRLEYQDGPKQVILYFDDKVGLPVKIQTFINEQPSEIWLYDFLSINTVKEKNMRHRTADEISSKEGFYSTAN